MDSSGHRRIDDIEVLRGFAIGLVLVEHVRLNLLPWVSGTEGPLYGNFHFWSGVDLFLAVSGFVIARSLLPLLAEARGPVEFFNVALSFWVRRAWRLLPSAWLWLAVILVATAAFNRSGAFGAFRTSAEGAVAAVLDVANFRTAYIFGHSEAGAAFPYWSLSLEEQFYLALPFVVYFSGRRLPLVLAVVVASQVFLRRNGPGGDVLLNMTKSDALALGVLLAIWRSRPAYWRLEPTALGAPALRWAFPPAFVVAFAALSGPHLVPGMVRVGVIGLLSAAIVWIASYDRDYLFPPGALKRGLCWLGARSYGVYLIHIPAFFVTREVWFRIRPQVFEPSPAHALALIATGLPVLVILAELNYRVVETPLRRRGALIAEAIRRRDLSAIAGLAPEAA